MNLVTSATPVAEISSFTLSLQKAGFYGHQIGLPLYSAAVVSSFFFSWPVLSGRRLDVYHTSMPDVALVQI